VWDGEREVVQEDTEEKVHHKDTKERDAEVRKRTGLAKGRVNTKGRIQYHVRQDIPGP
jgi:hypothetical protein